MKVVVCGYDREQALEQARARAKELGCTCDPMPWVERRRAVDGGNVMMIGFDHEDGCGIDRA